MIDDSPSGTTDDYISSVHHARVNDSDAKVQSQELLSKGDTPAPDGKLRSRSRGFGDNELLSFAAKVPTMNLVSGKVGTKESCVEIRRKSDCRPMSGKGRRYQSFCRLLEDVKEKVLFSQKGETEDVKTQAKKVRKKVPFSQKGDTEDVESQANRRHETTGSRRDLLRLTKSVGGSNSSSLRDLQSSGHGTHRDMGLPIGTHGRLLVQQSFYHLPGTAKKDLDGDDDNSKGNAPIDVVQYRLKTRNEKAGFWRRALSTIGISTGDSGIYDSGAGVTDNGLKICGIAPNNLVTTYLHWTFRSSFIAVFFSAALGFFSLTLLFALLIMVSGLNHPECIYVAGKEFGRSPGPGNMFADAFNLSWTTFATVGYGAIFPSTSGVTPMVHFCTGVSIICTLESFVGILFGGLCGAVLHGKVARIQSQAQVLFSDPIVIRYGSGVMNTDEDDEDDRSHVSGRTNKSNRFSGDSSKELSKRQIPCPVLEFRIVNRLHATKGGEIMDATMNIVASVDERQVGEDLLKASRQRRRRRGKFVGPKKGEQPKPLLMNRRSSSSDPFTTTAPTTIMERRPFKGDRGLEDSGDGQSLAHSEGARQAIPVAFDDEPDGHLAPKRMFMKLDVESPGHPFFKRVWLSRHILNQDSPLLTAEARQAVSLNGNFWPAELNNHDSVRVSVQFDQILVSLSGTSNVDANSVYGQKVYNHDDINVGYRFVNMLYRDELDSTLKVDVSVLNDVFEQDGGGGEPFQSFIQGYDMSMLGTMMFL